MYKFLISILVICFFYQLTYAQNQTVTSVYGGVVSNDKKPIEYATIQFLNTIDSSTIYGAITKNNGFFRLDSVLCKQYLIKISCVGFNTVFRTIDLSKSKKETYLKVFTLSIDTTQLTEIEIKGNAQGFYEFANKTVFYLDSISLKTSKDALDVLKKMPEIQVNKRSRSISVLGNSNVLVLINGVDNKRLVDVIKPSDIERIELITHPSAKYRSDIASVVNIVLKDKRKKGFSVFTDLTLSINQKNHFATIQFAYTFKRWNFFFTYNGMIFKTLNIDTTQRTIFSQGDKFQYLAVPIEKSVFNSNMQRIIYGMDFYPNKTTLISFTGQMNLAGYDYDEKQKSLYLINDTEKEVRKNFMGSKNNSVQQNYSFYFKKTFTNSNTFTVNTNLYFLNDNGNSLLTDTLFLPMNKQYSARNENTDNQQISVNSRFDYEYTFSPSLKLETGYQIYYRNISGNSYSNNVYSLLKYSDLRNSIYGTLDFETNKCGFEAGLRVEDYHISIYDTTHNNYQKALPQLSVVYKPKPHHTLRFSYNKKLKYPSLYYLNPYQFYSADSLSFSSGNPYLLPETSNEVIFKYIYKNKLINISTSLSYGLLDNLIISDFNVKENSLGSKYHNIGKVNKWGFNFDTYFVLFNFIETETYLYLSYYDFYNNSNHNGFSYIGGLSTYIPLPWDIDFDCTFLIGTKDIFYNGYSTENFLIDEVSLSKDILNGNGTIGISVWEPFLRNISSEKIWGNDFNESSSSETINNTVFLLEFTYSLSKGKKVKKAKKNLQMENNNKNGK